MKNTMEYKGYLGSVEFDEEEGLLFGRVMGIRSLISYEGESAKELLEDFHGAALADRGCARCVVTCARAPGEEELNKLRAALCRLHHKKDIQFDIRVEPALLGGFTLDIEGVTYDKSVRGALRRLERQLEERRMA